VASSRFLSDGFQERFDQRAVLKNEHSEAGPRVVVASEPSRARVVIDTDQYRVLAWIPSLDLHEVALEPIQLSSGAEKVAPPLSAIATQPGVVVGPGIVLERRSTKGSWVEVTASNGRLRGFGWMPVDRIGRVFKLVEPPRVDVAGDPWNILPGATLRAKAGGAKVGEVLDAPFDPVVVVSEVRRAGKHAQVFYQRGHMAVNGFVDVSKLRPLEPGPDVGWGVGMGPGAKKPSEALTFSPGTCLYDQPDGEVIGVLRSPLSATVHIETGKLAAWREILLDPVAPTVWAPRPSRPASGSSEPATGPLELPIDGWNCSQPR
jgi:hypothetical protein